MTRRHRSGGLVYSCPENRPGMVGKQGLLIHTLDDNLSSLVLCPALVDPSLDVLPSSASFAPHSTKVPSTYAIWRNTHGHRHSSENMLLTSIRVLLMGRGLPSCEGLPPLFGCPKINYKAKVSQTSFGHISINSPSILTVSMATESP